MEEQKDLLGDLAEPQIARSLSKGFKRKKLKGAEEFLEKVKKKGKSVRIPGIGENAKCKRYEDYLFNYLKVQSRYLGVLQDQGVYEDEEGKLRLVRKTQKAVQKENPYIMKLINFHLDRPLGEGITSYWQVVIYNKFWKSLSEFGLEEDFFNHYQSPKSLMEPTLSVYKSSISENSLKFLI